MIFVTVGSQLPFDRLVHAVDAWARAQGRGDVLAQAGATASPPPTIEWVTSLGPEAFERHVEGAAVVVGHAGTGTIMAALEAGRPVVVLPRREALGETRNDHQVATAQRFARRAGVFCADTEEEVGTLIELALSGAAEGKSAGAPKIEPVATGAIVRRLRGFLDEHLKGT